MFHKIDNDKNGQIRLHLLLRSSFFSSSLPLPRQPFVFPTQPPIPSSSRAAYVNEKRKNKKGELHTLSLHSTDSLLPSYCFLFFVYSSGASERKTRRGVELPLVPSSFPVRSFLSWNRKEEELLQVRKEVKVFDEHLSIFVVIIFLLSSLFLLFSYSLTCDFEMRKISPSFSFLSSPPRSLPHITQPCLGENKKKAVDLIGWVITAECKWRGKRFRKFRHALALFALLLLVFLICVFIRFLMFLVLLFLLSPFLLGWSSRAWSCYCCCRSSRISRWQRRGKCKRKTKTRWEGREEVNSISVGLEFLFSFFFSLSYCFSMLKFSICFS